LKLVDRTKNFHNLIANCQGFASAFAEEVCDLEYTKPGIQRIAQAIAAMEEKSFRPSQSVTRSYTDSPC